MNIPFPLDASFWWSFAFSGLCNLLTSIVFILFLFWFLRPQIKISNKIAFQNAITSSFGMDTYWFKIYSSTWLFSTYDIKIKLLLVKNFSTGGDHQELKTIHITSSIKEPPTLKAVLAKTSKNKNCLQFRSHEDIHSILNDDYCSISLIIECKHGLTGLPRVFYQKFDTVSDCESGRFVSGMKFIIRK